MQEWTRTNKKENQSLNWHLMSKWLLAQRNDRDTIAAPRGDGASQTKVGGCMAVVAGRPK